MKYTRERKYFFKISSPFKLKQNIIVIKFEAIQISNKKRKFNYLYNVNIQNEIVQIKYFALRTHLLENEQIFDSNPPGAGIIYREKGKRK